MAEAGPFEKLENKQSINKEVFNNQILDKLNTIK